MTATFGDPRLSLTFWSHAVADVSGCWLWTGATSQTGYGSVTVAGSTKIAHRVAHEGLVGPVPEGLELDHLCRVRNCVNPEHLEAVSHRENSLRSMSPWAIRARRTHCPAGHPLSEGNLRRAVAREGRRGCVTCARAAAAATHLLVKEAAIVLGLTQRAYIAEYGCGSRAAREVIDQSARSAA